MAKCMKNAIEKISQALINHDIQLWEVINMESLLKIRVQEIDSELCQYQYDKTRLQLDEQHKISHLIDCIADTMNEYEAKLWECVENKTEIQRYCAILRSEQKHLARKDNDFAQNQRTFEPFCDSNYDYIPELNLLEIKLEEKVDTVEQANFVLTPQTEAIAISTQAIKQSDDAESFAETTPIPVESRTPVQCNICQKTFNDRYYLKIHKEIHGGRKYDCDVCGKALTTRSRYRYHRKQHIKEGYPIERVQQNTCRLCAQKFASIKSLKEHMNQQHDGQKPLGCRHCEQF